MEEFYVKKLGLSASDLSDLRKRHNNDEIAVMTAAWHLRKAYVAPWIKNDVEKYITALPYRAWFLKNKLEKVWEECTMFEWNIILNVNPLYLYHAFSVPIPQCMDFATEYKLNVPMESQAFALAIKLIEESPMFAVSEAEMNQKMFSQGLQLVLPCKPFGNEPLKGHELEEVDLSKQSYGEIEVKQSWQRLALVREKKTCEMEIVLNGQKEYVMKHFAQELAFLLHQLNRAM